MTWTVVDTVLDDLDTHLAAPRPEQGGALLGHVAVPMLVVRFVHDPDAEVSGVSYRCSTVLADVVHAIERRSGLRLAGIAHSHPGLDRPSAQDHKAFRETLTKNPWMGSMLVPIITQLRPTAAHETAVPHGKVSWFEARALPRGVDVRPTEVRTLPMGRDLRRLDASFGTSWSAPAYVLVDGVGYAMVTLLADEDQWSMSGKPIRHLLFSATYPWQAPIPLVAANDEETATPANLQWDLGRPAAERLSSAWEATRPPRRAAPKPSAVPAEDFGARLNGVLDPLTSAAVLLVGAGSVGSFIAEVLARHGVGRITVVDPDLVEAANLSRTVYESADVGLAKVDALTRRLTRIRPDIAVASHRHDLNGLGDELLARLAADHDVVIGATDDMDAQGVLNAFAWSAGTPAVYPAIYREARAGEIVLAVPRPGGVCWRCTVLGSISTSDGERPHDYGTGRIVAATALGADVWTVSAAAAKLSLGLLHIGRGGSGPLATFVARPLVWGATLVQLATSPSWGPFDDWFAGAPGQWAYQSVWSTPTGDEGCPVCGPNPTAPRVPTLLQGDQRRQLLDLINDAPCGP